jgi:ABC-type amino acid transport substrate-binding protein
MSNGSPVKFTPLGIIVSLLLIVGLIGLGVYLVAPQMFKKSGATTETSSNERTPRTETGGDLTERDESGKTSVPQTNVLSRIRDAGVFRVGMEPEAPPMNSLDANGQRVGFDFEVALELAKKLGARRVEVVEADYDELPDKLRSGEVDAIMGGYVADPEVVKVDWSSGYLDFGLCLIVKQGSAVRETKHLAGKSIGIYADPAAKEWVKENVKDAGGIKEFQYTGWFAELDKGNVDAIIYDYPFAVEEIKKFPRLKIVKLNLNSSEYSVGIPARNDDYLDAMNASLKDLKESPSFETLVKKYFRSQAVQLADLPKGSKVYIVKQGDTLSKIAQREFGNPSEWPKIYELNKSRLANPHLIEIGFALLMP